jgi:N-formylglutamate deformylase
LQIEVNRSLYIDEITLRKKADFAKIARSIEHFFENFAAEVCSGSPGMSLAAE